MLSGRLFVGSFGLPINSSLNSARFTRAFLCFYFNVLLLFGMLVWFNERMDKTGFKMVYFGLVVLCLMFTGFQPGTTAHSTNLHKQTPPSLHKTIKTTFLKKNIKIFKFYSIDFQ